MTKNLRSPYVVPFDGTFNRSLAPTKPPVGAPSNRDCKVRRKALVKELSSLQRMLYARNRRAVLLVFQAMDAAGKDSTIRKVLSGVNPAGCNVKSFKQPSTKELNHDFLWRSACQLPERGKIGVFNRSYYEEVLVVRVHPEYLRTQRLPVVEDLDTLWEQRYRSIREHELHLARNGTVILKFWLNVSREEQRQRFLSRLNEPHKHWKFSASDVKERARWDDYMTAYEDALNATSRAHAPWHAIPADNKHYMRMRVAEIIVERLRTLDLEYPIVAPEEEERFHEMRAMLEAQAP